ncbi:MAG: radical SAM/SPASM domain-containing protein [Candidatus Tritonobacter lacicola]|nr:radical SAM/SPASM domain-containing protein [Candidatus Tritonobacter lacicola]
MEHIMFAKLRRMIWIYTFDAWRMPPRNIYIEITGACNFRCPNCPRTYANKTRGHMPVEMFRKVIKDIAEDYPELEHIGFHFFGEISMRKDFDTLINWAREKLPGTHFGISTNLSFEKKDVIDRLLRSDLDVIGVWPDAYSSESYEQIRTGGSFPGVRDNIRYLLEERARLNKSDIEVHVGMVKNKINQGYTGKFYKEFEFVDAFPGAGLVTIDSHDWAGQVPSGAVIDSAGNYKLKLPKVCPMPFYTLVVSAEGDVSLCCFDMNLNLKVGNVMKDGTIAGLWTSGNANAIRRGMKRLNPPEMCRHCHNFYFDLTPSRIIRKMKTAFMRRELKHFLLADHIKSARGRSAGKASREGKAGQGNS